MSDQRSDYELAYGEIQHAHRELGDTPDFWSACDAVEDRLISKYPEHDAAIIEMVAAWLVHMGVQSESALQGKV